MTPQSQTFPNVTPAQVATMVAELRATGATVTQPQASDPSYYVIEGHGVTASALYLASALSVIVTNKPFFVAIGTVWDGIRKALAA